MMKKIFLIFACSLTTTVQSLDYQLHFENDQVCVANVIILPHEEIGLHRDVTPQVVIATKGGIITRLETDGREVDIEFPTGIAVFRPSEPEDQLHRSVNKSDQSVELIIIQLKNTSCKCE